MDKLEKLKEKQKGIGGSDVGAIMGMNKWKSGFEVYAEKTEEIKEIPEPGEAAYFGLNLKDIISREFMNRTGKQVRRYTKQLVHKKYSFMIANIDRMVLGENSIMLCKTTSVFGAKEWEGEEIPPSCIFQCQHYMAVSEADKCYVAVLIGGQKLLIKEIQRDNELIEMIIEAEMDFWNNHVLTKVPPSLDCSDAAEKYLKNKYSKSNSSLQIDLKADNKDKIARYLSLKDNIKLLEDEVKTIENNIKNELGEAEKGVVENFIVSWKAVLKNNIDSEILKDKYPEVYKEVRKEKANRRFEIKTREVM